MKSPLMVCALLAAVASPVAAQATKKPAAKQETEAQLKAAAKLSLADATKAALLLVPGTVKSSELERENGKLIYSFDIATKGKTGIDEVWIDAVTGKQVGAIEHETPKMEKAEEKPKTPAVKRSAP